MEIRYESLAEGNKKLRKRVASSRAMAAEVGEVVRRRPRSEEKKALLKRAVKAGSASMMPEISLDELSGESSAFSRRSV